MAGAIVAVELLHLAVLLELGLVLVHLLGARSSLPNRRRSGQQRPKPAVIMAHGFASVKAGGLEPFAERFAATGSPPLISTTATGAARVASLPK
jgi:hypothetical protein